MKKLIIRILFKFLTIENVSALAAKCVVWLLEYARNKGDAHWNRAKEVVRSINNWCSLFLEVYEDDNLTEEEEEKIAEAIKKETSLQTIAEILKKKLKKHNKKTETATDEVKRVANKAKTAKRNSSNQS